MKIRDLIISIILVVVTACDGEVPDLKQKILFQRHYVNYAWFYTDSGYLVDSMGYVRPFDVARRKLKWNYPDSLGYISKEAMDQNLSYCDAVISQVSADSLSHYVGKIWGASRGVISKPDMQMADFGEIRYSAYIFDVKKNRYKEVLIKLYGDIMCNNSSSEAEELYGWMNRIGQK